jgi:hypothetical protein
MMIHPHDPGPASAAAVTRSTSTDERATFDSAYRLLLIRGLSSVEAGNLVAYVAGLHAAEGGWTLQEIKHLVALRSFVARGFIES